MARRRGICVDVWMCGVITSRLAIAYIIDFIIDNYDIAII